MEGSIIIPRWPSSEYYLYMPIVTANVMYGLHLFKPTWRVHNIIFHVSYLYILSITTLQFIFLFCWRLKHWKMSIPVWRPIKEFVNVVVGTPDIQWTQSIPKRFLYILFWNQNIHVNKISVVMWTITTFYMYSISCRKKVC